MRVFLFTLLILTSCAPPSSEPNAGLNSPVDPSAPRATPQGAKGVLPTRFIQPSSPTEHKDRVQYSGDFDPKKVKFVCKPGLDCPAAVGVLIFALPMVEAGKVPLELCTATLIAGDKILTAEHCDFFGEAKSAFFITRSDLPGGARISRIGKVEYNEYKKAEDPKQASGFPDVAVMDLLDPVSGIKALELGRGQAKTYASLRAWVVQHSPTDDLDMSLDKLDCVVHPDGMVFPYKLSEAPKMLRAFDCQAQGGNSGAPLMNGALIEAVLDARADVPKGQRQNILATNVRCIDFPNQSPLNCLQPTQDDIQARVFAAASAVEAPILTDATKPLEPGAKLGYKTKGYLLNGPKEPIRYEVFSTPTCRTEGWDQKSADLFSQVAYLSYDDWNNPRLAYEGAKARSTGTVTGLEGNRFQFHWTWTSAPGVLQDPRGDFRNWPATSSIDLPFCTR